MEKDRAVNLMLSETGKERSSQGRAGARRASLLIALVAWAPLAGCSGIGTYFQRRAMDLTDVIDLKGGLGFGLGAKAEASIIQPAFGMGHYKSLEFFGRARHQAPNSFIHFGVYGMEFSSEGCCPHDMDIHFLTLNTSHLSPTPDKNQKFSWIDRLRFGGEVLLPFVNGGVYLNLGELADFFTGLVGYDLAGDDDLPKGISSEEKYRKRES